MKKIVIIGGGTAGWLTALAVNKFWKNINLTVIESSKIGILGAGEGSTPNFGLMLNLLDIDEKEFFNKTNSTIKKGLNFKNWTLDKREPKHIFFNSTNNITPQKNAYHFDGRLVGQYFKEISIERGVNHIDNEVIDVEKINDKIHTILLNNNEKIENVDFIFDCSGFAKIIIEKTHNEKWISYKDYLSLNKAIGYFLPQNTKFKITDKTYTELVSMNCGWMWQIPLQHRWGCGYVFDDSFTTIEDAKREIEEYVGTEIKIQKIFEFNPGRFERSWIGNSVSIGLSYGFLEPLEATSLMSTIMQLKKLIDINFDEDGRDEYNGFCGEVMEQNMFFIRYHYLCERFDTPFWRKSYSMPIPKKLKNILNEDNHMFLDNDHQIITKLELEKFTTQNIIFGVHNYSSIFKKNKKLTKSKLL
jgi:Tryptophan halogenase